MKQQRSNSWDPWQPATWSNCLGFAQVPLFPERHQECLPSRALMLDGDRGSFVFIADDASVVSQNEHTFSSWAWSSNVRSCLILDRQKERVILSRWDGARPTMKPSLQIPRNQTDMEKIVSLVDASRSTSIPSVIDHLMTAFRQVRAHVSDGAEALTVFNALLLAARAIALEHKKVRKPQKLTTVADLRKLFDVKLTPVVRLETLSPATRELPLDLIISFFVEPAPESGLRLDASLLFRHAASQLYEEAHIELERDPQLTFWGLSPTPYGRLPRETRYTPTNLVRSLVEQTGALLPTRATAKANQIVVLDPACGSGVFLVQFAHYAKGYLPDTLVQLHGIDISRAATDIATSGTKIAILECGPKIQCTIQNANALQEDWPEADIILMNPPFVSIQDIASEDRKLIDELFGSIGSGRYDKATAFLYKAWKSLKVGGTLATVLPASLLRTRSGDQIRESISSNADIRVIGRFEGFSYFSDSLVETAFVILTKRCGTGPASVDRTRVLIAREGREDRALRVLRTGRPTIEQQGSIELFDVPSTMFTSTGSWYPQRSRVLRLLEDVRSLGFATAGNLFTIHQGARTGNNAAFLLSHDDLQSLPENERIFFRPAAGQGAIADGQIHPVENLFFPFTPGGRQFADETELRRECPTYHQNWLQPFQVKLAARKKIEEWWLPTWPRTWQFGRVPKLVSTYSGGSGSFAYDSTGDCVIVQGFGWFPTKPTCHIDGEDADFFESDLPWAYLALLNSKVFERVAEAFSSRLAGGQLLFDKKYVSEIPLPDLADASFVSFREELGSLGSSIHTNGFRKYETRVDRIVGELYHLPLQEHG